ncbi:MAG: aminotransferase class I/II-fold pyridoxal phosphate-dependent enzyme [Thiotrichales bacterium]|nr:aminotransferase class I/II-fold pyridoxal phosphate-dependent enzyme [Thiotrichales bacterium]
MHIDAMDAAALARAEAELERRYAALRAEGLNLDLTRGKPAGDQLDLSAALDGALDGGYRTEDGTDARGYGGSDGIVEARRLGAAWLGLAPDEVLAGGNSSLTLMYLFLLGAHRFGLDGPGSAWADDPAGARFLCPAPGYDRHFAICEDLGIEMIPVPMTGEGPGMDRVEALVAGDPGVRGMWCVPRYSNPTGETYSADTVRRIAALGRTAAPGFRVMWDNAYAVHHLADPVAPLENVMAGCRTAGTEDSVVQFASTSKVTFAGAGVAFFGGSRRNVDWFRARLSVMTIGPDKVNQLRHLRRLPDMDAVHALMERHAALLRPKFDCVQRRLEAGLGNLGMGRWTDPDGGYFVSFWTRPGLAKETVRLAAQAGVRLTPAGAAYPRGEDPEDRHIRLAPSFPPLAEVDRAMEVFVTCVKLAAVRGARRTGAQ